MANTTPPNCKTCPSFQTGAGVVDAYGRATGSPMCVRFGTVLGKPGLPAEHESNLHREIASRCDSYGDPAPAIVGRDHTVMLPMPGTRENIDERKRDVVTSCSQCTNLIGERVVAEKFGWTAGLCAAKGKLIMTNRLAIEARGCEFRQFGPSVGDPAGMEFLPIYQDAFLSGEQRLAREIEAQRQNAVEPGDYITDKPLTPEDEAANIKAWRAFTDPDGSGNTAYLPIYDESMFSDEERALIPRTGDDEHPELYVDYYGGMYALAIAWMELDETPAFWGQPGVGKTELARYAAWIMCLPFLRLSITADSQIEDVAGSKEYSPEKGTYFVYGQLPKAWTSRGILVIDEPNVAKDPAVWHFIRPLTDNSKQMVLTMNGNERLPRHPDCYMMMAMNPAWDVRNSGAMEVADADTNRLFHTYIDMPPATLEKQIIQERVKLDGWELDTGQIKMVMGIAEDLRELANDEGASLPFTWAIRQQIKVSRLLRWYSPPMAYRKAIGDALEPEVTQIILDTVNSHWESAS